MVFVEESQFGGFIAYKLDKVSFNGKTNVLEDSKTVKVDSLTLFNDDETDLEYDFTWGN